MLLFDLSDSYVWDFWTAADGPQTHLFFLHAPRALQDPELRHDHARVGHAVSEDLKNWQRVGDPVSPVEGFDDLATWTGSCHRVGSRWLMLLTGRSYAEAGRVQRVGLAWSEDLLTWRHHDTLIDADPRWYACWPTFPETHWRDPWLERAPDGTWHMLVTARSASARAGAGVIGHATSLDLRHWQVQPPLSEPTGRFNWQEVVSVAEIDGRRVLLFCCLSDQMPGAAPGAGGIWWLRYGPPGSPIDIERARRLTDESSYVGKVVRHQGADYFVAFRNTDAQGDFVGGLTTPVRISWRGEELVLEQSPSQAQPDVD